MRSIFSSNVCILIIYALTVIGRGYSYEALVVVKNMSIFGHLTLPFKATIEDGKTIYPENNEIQYAYLCPHPDEDKIKEVWENIYRRYYYLACLFKESTPTDKEGVTCSRPVRPILTKRHDTDVNCKQSRSNSLLYDFGFYESIMYPIKTYNINIYHICFENTKRRTWWTKHTVQSSILSENPTYLSRMPIIKNDLSTENFGFYSHTFSKIAKSYENQEKKEDRMVPHMMVPAEDLVVPLWQKTTLHYANTNPLWIELEPLMEAINIGIRKAAVAVYKSERRNLAIYTATKELDLLKKIGSFLIDSFGWNIWCKFVYNSGTSEGVMIYVHSLPHNPPTEENPSTSNVQEQVDTKKKNVNVGKECKDENVIPCNIKKWSDKSVDDTLKYAYCCRVDNQKIYELFNLELIEDLGELKMDDIINQYQQQNNNETNSTPSD